MNAGRMLSAVTKSGDEIQVKIGLSPVVIDGNDYILASIIEAKNEVLKMSSYNDPLTGLPNRVYSMKSANTYATSRLETKSIWR